MKSSNTFLLVSVLVGMGVHVCAREAAAQREWAEESDRNEEAVSKALRPVLHSLGGGVRIDYHAVCRQTRDNQKAILFPRVNVQKSSSGVTGLDAVRKIFRKDHRVAIVQNPRDPFRIRIGTVSGALLQTRIPTLKLNPHKRYNPFEALSALEVTSEFNAAIQKLHLYNGLVVMSGRLLDPEPDLRTSSRIENVTSAKCSTRLQQLSRNCQLW